MTMSGFQLNVEGNSICLRFALLALSTKERQNRFMEEVNTHDEFLSISKLGRGLQELNSRKFHLHLTFKASWNNFDDV